ncbi:nitroreductase/quinone reductase family protein [Spongisporangium articulatum]|uniref:Nitroreductase/quinone reductase family protein n=1 Tax=Spongisporangium articulatum TaxID=3362603 RepID=A0ABW8AT67_9ACTN
MAGWNEMVIEQFRAGQARIADRFDREYLLLLHTVGARSGEPRLSPVAYKDDGGRLLIAASAGGRPQHPSWYFNLVANPEVTVERWVDGQLVTQTAHATAPEGAERDRLWDEFTAWSPGFKDYEKSTDRRIPVIVLEPTS